MVWRTSKKVYIAFVNAKHGGNKDKAQEALKKMGIAGVIYPEKKK